MPGRLDGGCLLDVYISVQSILCMHWQQVHEIFAALDQALQHQHYMQGSCDYATHDGVHGCTVASWCESDATCGQHSCPWELH